MTRYHLTPNRKVASARLQPPEAGTQEEGPPITSSIADPTRRARLQRQPPRPLACAAPAGRATAIYAVRIGKEATTSGSTHHEDQSEPRGRGAAHHQGSWPSRADDQQSSSVAEIAEGYLARLDARIGHATRQSGITRTVDLYRVGSR